MSNEERHIRTAAGSETADRFALAVRLEAAGDLAGADRLLAEQLASHPDHAEAHFRRGSIALRQRRADDAIMHLRRAAALAPRHPIVFCVLANALQDAGLLQEAADALRHAIAIAPALYQAYNNLGLLLHALGRPDDAIAMLEQAIAARPDYLAAIVNLGVIHADGGNDAIARTWFQRATALAPDAADGWFRLAEATRRLGCAGDAVAAYRQVLQLQPGHPGALVQLAHCMAEQGEVDRAGAMLRAQLATPPFNLETALDLAALLAANNEPAQARDVYRMVTARDPGNWRAWLGQHLTLPVVYSSSGEAADARSGYLDGIAQLDALARTWERQGRRLAIADLAWSNFYLAYQGMADRELQVRFDEVLARLRPPSLPEPAPVAVPAPGAGRRRVRVGFASSLLRTGTVGGYFSSWITGLNPVLFETFVYHLGRQEDGLSRTLKASAAHYNHLGRSGADLPEWRRHIGADRLDILIYPELGMDPNVFALAGLRLAPLQCAGWGHPVTTGLASIDVFFSCATMEPPDAQEHYSERLVLLPGIGTGYPAQPLPVAADRAALGLPPDRHLYLFPHPPFKIHPDNDALLARIAAADPQASFVLIEGRPVAPSRHVAERLARHFEHCGIEPAGRFIVLPYMGHDDYLRLNQAADLLLDCLHWSGGNTSLDAIRAGLPVVTLPGPFMRSRQTAAMLQLAAVPELIAASPGAYVDIALRVATSKDLRGRLSKRLRNGANMLFDRQDALGALQAFLLAACPMS